MKVDDLSLPLRGKCHCGSVRFEVSTNIKNYVDAIVLFVLEKALLWEQL